MSGKNFAQISQEKKELGQKVYETLVNAVGVEVELLNTGFNIKIPNKEAQSGFKKVPVNLVYDTEGEVKGIKLSSRTVLEKFDIDYINKHYNDIIGNK